MGLDWVLLNKPKEDYEEEYATILQEMENIVAYEEASIQNKNRIEEIKQRIEEISISSYQTAGCKFVGIDPEADQYVQNMYPTRSEEELKMLLQEMKGYPITKLASDKEGFAKYSGIAVSDFDFRGQALQSIKSLPKDLIEEAFDFHSAYDTIKYGGKLQCFLNEQRGLLNEEEIDILESAVTWLIYWGNKGHGFKPWF
jgi:hypothetical protein